MLLTLSTTRRPASDLGYLLHKHPDRFQTFPQSFGSAHVFYPELGEGRCSACLLLEVDPVALSRGKGDASAPSRPTASAYRTHCRVRTSVRNSVLSMQRIILPRRLSLIG